MHECKYLLSISYVLLRICCYFKFFKDKFFCRSLHVVTVEYNFNNSRHCKILHIPIENVCNFVAFNSILNAIKANCSVNLFHARNRFAKREAVSCRKLFSRLIKVNKPSVSLIKRRVSPRNDSGLCKLF